MRLPNAKAAAVNKMIVRTGLPRTPGSSLSLLCVLHQGDPTIAYFELKRFITTLKYLAPPHRPLVHLPWL